MELKSISFTNLSYNSRCVYASFLAIFGLASISGNIISIVAFCERTMRSKSNHFLISLAVSDLLVGGMCILSTCHLMIDQLFFTKDFIIISFILISFCTTSSTISLAWISYDRFCKLDPQTYDDKISDLKSKLVIVSAWIAPGIIELFIFVHLDITKILLVISTIISACIICVFYRRIRRKIKADTLALNNATQDEETKKLRLQKDKRSGRRLTVLIFSYFACFMPIGLGILLTMLVTSVLDLDSTTLQHFRIIGICALTFDSVLNPIIHLSTNEKMRKVTKKDDWFW